MTPTTLLAALLLSACSKQVPPNEPEPSQPASADLVCCESYGFGAMMAKCCESYAWTTADACTVSPEHVGGGKDVVDDALCADAPKPD